jgi:hypothetical protein
VAVRPELREELHAALGMSGDEDQIDLDEDPEFDEKLDALLEANHLAFFVDAIVDSLTAEE